MKKRRETVDGRTYSHIPVKKRKPRRPPADRMPGLWVSGKRNPTLHLSAESITGINRSVATDSYLSQAKIQLALEGIRRRIGELERIRENYLRYQDDRVRERDHHGAWGVAVNLAETEAEIAGLRFAEKALA